MWCENVLNRVSETFPMGNENVPVARESVGHTWRPYTKKIVFLRKKVCILYQMVLHWMMTGLRLSVEGRPARTYLRQG